MAIMIPALSPKETDSSGEKTLFSILKHGLSDEFTIIHSLPWLCAAVKQIDRGAPPTGEIDFLVIHPELGVLVLEVKSGQYRVDGLLFVNLKTGYEVDPVRQTRRNTHGLARWLGADPSLRVRMGYGFVFPDSHFGDAVISAAMIDVTVDPPQQVFVDRGQIPRVAERIQEIMVYWKKALKNSELGVKKVQQIVEVLCPQYDGMPTWATRAIYDGQLWLRLTGEQTKVVEVACNRQRMVVTGWPGTGKTLIAVEVARQSVLAGKRVLFITFNNRLADYIRKQFSPYDSGCTVSTWHSLCSTARKKLKRPVNQTDEWFKGGCLTDLQEGIEQGLMGNYDVLVLDEAQVLLPDWCQALIDWFKDKQVLGFCDETQVFKFEKQATKLEQLCAQLGDVKPFFLTIVLRMPATVTDRLLSVKPSSYQLTSPRNSEPDTLQESLAQDGIAAFKETVQNLKMQGLLEAEIVVLTKHGMSPALEDIVTGLGVKHETVARFRGLEAPAVIVLGSELMDDAELFCAYSRATTVCIALYSPEELGWKANGDFHRTLLATGSNEAQAKSARSESLTRTLMAHQMASRMSSIQTVRLAWSETWKAWLVELDHPNDPAETWIDYLIAHHPWPVFFWYGTSRREIQLALPTQGMACDFNSSNFKLWHCAVCDEFLPHQPSAVVPCLACAKNMKGLVSSPKSNLFTQLAGYDELLRAENAGAPEFRARLQSLPLPLAVAGARIFAFANKRRSKVVSAGLPTGGLMYRSALAYIQSQIAYVKTGKLLVAETLAETTYRRYEALRHADVASWQKTLAMALGTCYSKKLLTKSEKGQYEPVDD